jgi:hypothetical protein
VSYSSSQLSPPASTRETRLRIVARGLNSPSPKPFHDAPAPAWIEPDLRECVLAEGDCEACPVGERGHSLGNILLGVAVIVGVSGGFWTGVGLLIARLLR